MKKSNETHFIGNVNQKALIFKDGKILLVQYAEKDKTHHPNPKAWGKWDMLGGRLNEGENVLAGFRREISEEIGAEITIEKIITNGTYTNLAGTPTFFIIYQVSLVDKNKPLAFNDAEVAVARWFEPKEFFTLPIIYPEYQEALRSILV